MQVVKKAFILIFIVWFSCVVFMPKQNLYCEMEQVLASQGIKINEKKISEGLFTLSIDNAVVYIKGIALIHVKQASFFSLLFYNSIELKGIVLDDSLKRMAPTHLDEVKLSYGIWSPKHISVSGQGTFGVFEGDVDLVEHKIHLDLNATTKAGVWKYQLKKGEKGLYYETSF